LLLQLLNPLLRKALRKISNFHVAFHLLSILSLL
jgi:hypothetical protein